MAKEQHQHEFLAVDGLGIPTPSSLSQAVSVIQQISIIESGGAKLAKEYFTVTHLQVFTNISVKSVYRDFLIWVIGYIVISSALSFYEHHYMPGATTRIFFWDFQGSAFLLFSEAASYAGIIFSTVLCVWASYYYKGAVTKKIVATVLFTRAMMLVCFAFAVFTILGLIYKILLADQNIVKFSAEISKFINFKAGENIYYYLYKFKRHVFEASVISLVASFASTVLPLLTLVLLAPVRKRKEEKVKKGE